MAGGFDFRDISGNDKIVVSIVVPESTELETDYAALLFDSRIVSNPDATRLVMLVPVSDLREFIIEVRGKGHRLEHIYDY